MNFTTGELCKLGIRLKLQGGVRICTPWSAENTKQRNLEAASAARSIGNFVKDNALEQEPLEDKALAVFVGAEELRRISTEQLLGSRFWGGTMSARRFRGVN